MSWKWGGRMSSKCIYYVEGLCEQQLIAALKENPARLIPGKVRNAHLVHGGEQSRGSLSLVESRRVFT